jgi:peptidoglycan glycosyltransferase/penicillin-binding protein 2
LILGVIILTLFLYLILRIAVIQFIPDRSLEEAAFRQRVSSMGIERIRGNILDRNSIPFTNRNIKYAALIQTACMPPAGSEREKVCAVLNADADMLNSLTGKSKPLILKTDKAGRDALLGLDIDWVSIMYSVERYEEDSLARHVIGYVNRRDQVGQVGIEKAYEKILRDKKVYEIGTVTDAAKNPIKGLGYRLKDWSGSGRKLDVKLTLDYHIQKIVEKAMDNSGISGAVVVEDVVTGDILAMASRPHFEQNAVENYLDSSGNELFNKATAAYNLGSIFKIIDVAAFYENEKDIMSADTDNNSSGDIDDKQDTDGSSDEYRFFDGFGYSHLPFADELFGLGNNGHRSVLSDFDHYYCSGAVDISGLTFKCYSYYEGGHGGLDLERAFTVSCNSYFIELCQKIGYRRLVDMAQKFGLGNATGISGQGVYESSGNLPDKSAFHSKADVANLAIGQGVLLATPLQVADITATIANGGIKNRVNIVDSIVDADGRIVEKIKVSQGSRIISKETADKIKKLMEAVTLNGTGTEAVMGYYGGAGGKTGSAETGSKDIVHAWFAGYFPAAQPRYAIAVFAENGRLGGKSAAPVFAEIAKNMIEKGY